MLKKSGIRVLCALGVILLALLPAAPLFPRDADFQMMEIETISRYFEDRIAYQHIQRDISKSIDNSIASLLIIKERKVYLIKDGYDNPKDVELQRIYSESESRLAGDLYLNKIKSKPNFIRITERRVEVLKHVGEEFVSKNFGSFYLNVRNAFIQKHVNVFRQLMSDRKESGLVIDRQIIPRPIQIGAATNEPVKYSLRVWGKTIDEKIYFAEDADGDEVAETFTVNSPDGFNWGFKSGPNIIFIYDNKEEDIKQIMGSLVRDAYYGTPDEEKSIVKTFPKDSEIISEFNLDKVAVTQSKESK